MIDIITVYCAVMYLITGGIMFAAVLDREKSIDLAIGMTILFVLSPIITPIFVGTVIYNIGID